MLGGVDEGVPHLTGTWGVRVGGKRVGNCWSRLVENSCADGWPFFEPSLFVSQLIRETCISERLFISPLVSSPSEVSWHAEGDVNRCEISGKSITVISLFQRHERECHNRLSALKYFRLQECVRILITQLSSLVDSAPTNRRHILRDKWELRGVSRFHLEPDARFERGTMNI